FKTDNWEYNEEHDYYVCPNGQKLTFQYFSNRTDHYGFTREFKVYQSENCNDCPLRSYCTKAKEGNNRRLFMNEKWEQQKDRKSTRLNSSHVSISYAVFCLKKKKYNNVCLK